MDNKKQRGNNMEPSAEQRENNMESNEEQQENDMEPDEEGDAASKYVPYFDIGYMKTFTQYHIDLCAKRIEAVKEVKEQLLQESENIQSLQRVINNLIEPSKQNAKS